MRFRRPPITFPNKSALAPPPPPPGEEGRGEGEKTKPSHPPPPPSPRLAPAPRWGGRAGSPSLLHSSPPAPSCVGSRRHLGMKPREDLKHTKDSLSSVCSRSSFPGPSALPPPPTTTIAVPRLPLSLAVENLIQLANRARFSSGDPRLL
jgi:hypothetical protein